MHSLQSLDSQVYSLHHAAHALTRSAAVLVGLGHMLSPHLSQSSSLHVAGVHHDAQPSTLFGMAAQFGLSHCRHAETWQCSLVHQASQPSVANLHFGLLQLAHSFASHVDVPHQLAQPEALTWTVGQCGFLQFAQSSTPQCESVHHDAQPGRSGMHFGLSQALHSATPQVCLSHHDAQPVADPPPGPAVWVAGRISVPGPQPCSLRQSVHESCLH